MKKAKFAVLVLMLVTVGCFSNSFNVKNYEVTGKLKDTLEITKVEVNSVQEKDPFLNLRKETAPDLTVIIFRPKSKIP